MSTKTSDVTIIEIKTEIRIRKIKWNQYRDFFGASVTQFR